MGAHAKQEEGNGGVGAFGLFTSLRFFGVSLSLCLTEIIGGERVFFSFSFSFSFGFQAV